MPLTTSAKKALRASRRKRVFNTRRLKTMRESIKNVRQLKTSQEGTTKLSVAYKAIDKAVKRGIIKKNTGDRKKSRLAKLLAKKK